MHTEDGCITLHLPVILLPFFCRAEEMLRTNRICKQGLCFRCGGMKRKITILTFRLKLSTDRVNVSCTRQRRSENDIGEQISARKWLPSFLIPFSMFLIPHPFCRLFFSVALTDTYHYSYFLVFFSSSPVRWWRWTSHSVGMDQHEQTIRKYPDIHECIFIKCERYKPRSLSFLSGTHTHMANVGIMVGSVCATYIYLYICRSTDVFSFLWTAFFSHLLSSVGFGSTILNGSTFYKYFCSDTDEFRWRGTKRYEYKCKWVHMCMSSCMFVFFLLQTRTQTH